MSVLSQEFLDGVLGSGLLVYLSPVWLSEVYDLITDVDVFEFGLRQTEGKMSTLRNLLVDLDGLGRTHRGAQLLCEYRRFNTDLNRSMNRNEDSECYLN